MTDRVTDPTAGHRIDRGRIAALMSSELERFERRTPRSAALHREAQRSLLAGVPMSWMTRWPGPYPVFVDDASGGRFTDVDANTYIDLCLGDTGAMTGHSLPATVASVEHQAARGITTMLPSTDAIAVADELRRRFGLPVWQIAMTATDANRFALRLARHATGRRKVLVFDWCYHGTVDEALNVMGPDGRAVPRPGNTGWATDPSLSVEVVQFNDVAALERALAACDVAAVLAEPALTNIGIVLPDADFHRTLRELTQRTSTLLILDETHTMCTGPGGYTAAYGLQPDILTVGKSIGSGMAAAAFGVTKAVAERMFNRAEADYVDTGGVGGTLAGNALSLAAMRATLEQVLTADAFAKTIPLAQPFTAGVQAVIAEYNLPWHVTQLGCRAEYRFRPAPPRNGGEAAAASDGDLDRYMHLFALNRGILLTPFHNMALIAPATTEQDIDYHTEVFRQSVQALLPR